MNVEALRQSMLVMIDGATPTPKPILGCGLHSLSSVSLPNRDEAATLAPEKGDG